MNFKLKSIVLYLGIILLLNFTSHAQTIWQGLTDTNFVQDGNDNLTITYFNIASRNEEFLPKNCFSPSVDKTKIIQTLLDAVTSGKAKAYKPIFNKDSVIMQADIERLIHGIDTMVFVENPYTKKADTVLVVMEDVNAESINYIAFVEDWHFDAEKFKLEKIVMRACLFKMFPPETENGKASYKPLFWVKFNN